MKRTSYLLILLAILAMILVGCGHEHDFQYVSCDAPLTCSVCGKTEGEAVGHEFSQATCTEPSKCIKCGETQGEALGHKLSEANYQDAPICSVCGATVGSPLTPGFEEHRLKINVELNTDYPYVTSTYDGEDQTTGAARFTDFKAIKGDDVLPEKDGYIWLSIHEEIEFTDEASWMHGYRPGLCLEDYYDIEGHDKSVVKYEGESIPEEYKGFSSYATYKVSFHGIDYDCERLFKVDENSGWIGDHHAHSGGTYYFHVPEDYDGTVIGLYHYDFNHLWDEGLYIYDMAGDDALFLRLNPSAANN